MKTYKRVMTIAGSDSGGGAGIQADIKTISACGCFATSAITAITAQNTVGVRAIHPIPIDIIEKQIEAILDDIGTDAVKIGMLHNADTIEIIAKLLKEYKVKNIVLDPVMVATSGDRLLENEAIDALKNILLPMATIITPNIPEAEILLNKKIDNQEELPTFAKELSEKYGVSVLIKAGHLTDYELIDIFYNVKTKELIELQSKRVDTKNTHGTGCTLSSALVSFIAKGDDLNQAAKNAKDYINDAIIAGKDYEVGNGHGPVKHFYNFW